MILREQGRVSLLSTRRGESGSFLRGWIGAGSARRHGTSEEQATSVLVRVRPSGFTGRERPHTLFGVWRDASATLVFLERPSGSSRAERGRLGRDTRALPRGVLRGSWRERSGRSWRCTRSSLGSGVLREGFGPSAGLTQVAGPSGLADCTGRRPKGRVQAATLANFGLAVVAKRERRHLYNLHPSGRRG